MDVPCYENIGHIKPWAAKYVNTCLQRFGFRHTIGLLCTISRVCLLWADRTEKRVGPTAVPLRTHSPLALRGGPDDRRLENPDPRAGATVRPQGSGRMQQGNGDESYTRWVVQ